MSLSDVKQVIKDWTDAYEGRYILTFSQSMGNVCP